jgi:hypothetical protein
MTMQAYCGTTILASVLAAGKRSGENWKKYDLRVDTLSNKHYQMAELKNAGLKAHF